MNKLTFGRNCMPKILKINLSLFLLILSISTGFAASSENLSASVEKITSISQIVKPYFDKLVVSSGTNLKEQPVIGGLWSPDGSRLEVGESINPQRGVTLHAIYILNADGSGIRELASTPNNTNEESLTLGMTPWSPDGNRIGIYAFISDVRYFYVLADPDKTLIKTAGKCNYTTVDEMRENIQDLEWQHDFIWNPDGTKALILMDKKPMRSQLYILDPNGFVLQQLTDTPNEVELALWSHDGKKIAYTVYDLSEREHSLWIVNENGTEKNKLNNDGVLFAWSPDDSRIFYYDENSSLYSIKVDGTDRIQLSKKFSRNEDIFDFSPSGKNLIFSTVNADGVSIFLADSRGDNKKILEEFPGYLVIKPSWSPKGDRIAFAQDDNLYTINPDGSGKNLVASSITDYEWHPSGDYISFVSSGSIFTASPDGSAKIQLTEDGKKYKFLNGWSPDGSRLIVSNEPTDLSIIKLKGYEDPLSIDLPTAAKGKSCEIRVRCMSEPVADALLTLNNKEIGFTNSSGFLNYSCPDAGRYILNASKTGYWSASKVLIVQENSSVSPVKSAVSEPSSNSGKEKVARSEPQIPGFRGITVVLLLIFFIRRRSSL